MPSSGARSKLRLVLHCNECASSSQKGARWDMSARTQPELSERFTAGSGKVAHLFRRLDARTLKILSVKRRRAGRLDVGTQASSLTLDLHAVGLTAVHSHGYGACTAVSPAFWRGRPRAPARVPVQSPLAVARRCNLITPPLGEDTQRSISDFLSLLPPCDRAHKTEPGMRLAFCSI